MIEDPDVIFVDFDELFDAQALNNAFGGSSGKKTMSAEIKAMDTDHGFGNYASYPAQNMPNGAMDYRTTQSNNNSNLPYAYPPPPPPGYPHPFHAAYYYPHHHGMHPGVFYPPGSLPHHHVNPMNPYPVAVDPSLYQNVPPATNASHVVPNPSPHGSEAKVTTVKEELLAPTTKRNRKGSESSMPSTSPKVRAKKEVQSVPPPPPMGDSPILREEESASSKPMTREQFYKIRPKLPRISKSDPRRLYAAAFGDAYNSCGFEKIWEFMSTYCTKDVLFVHRWVGSELYLNFPKYLEVRGIESVAEYWFSRCLVAPDLVLENKETKLYVRSDGISTVLSSFTIVCTRLYDGEISDSIICRPAVDADLCQNNSTIDLASMSEGESPSGEDQSLQKPEEICNRVLEKVDRILSKVEPLPKRRTMKRKSSEDSMDEDSSLTTNSTNGSSDAPLPLELPSSSVNNSRKRMPKDQSITLLGTVTLHVNTDFKIRQIELNFALQQ